MKTSIDIWVKEPSTQPKRLPTGTEYNDYVDPHTGEALIPAIFCRLTIKNEDMEYIEVEQVSFLIGTSKIKYEDCPSIYDARIKIDGDSEEIITKKDYRATGLYRGEQITMHADVRTMAEEKWKRSSPEPRQRSMWVYPLVKIEGMKHPFIASRFRINLAYAKKIERKLLKYRVSST